MAYRANSSMLERFPSRLSATSPSPCGAHDSEFTRIVRILCLSISELDIQQQSNSGRNRFLEHPALDSSAEFVDLRVDLTKVGIILHDRDHRGPSLICRSRTSPMDWCSRYIATFTGMPQQTRARLSAAKITPGPRNRIGMPGHSGGDITRRREVGTSSRDIGSIRPPNGPPGDRIAFLSTSFAAAGAFPRFIRDAAAPAASTPRKRAQRAHTTVMTLPAHRLRSLTWDQGKEMSQHPQFTITTGRPCVYFCDPHRPLAARLQQEHEWVAAPVLSEEQRHDRQQPATSSRRPPSSTHGHRKPRTGTPSTASQPAA